MIVFAAMNQTLAVVTPSHPRSRRFIFADEAGCFTFNRNPNVSRHFIVCTVTMDNCAIAHDLLALRRELVWEGAPVRDQFHATEDKQTVRDRVFDVLGKHDFRVQATVMEKAKAFPHLYETEARFYQYGWFYHFRHALARFVEPVDQLQITAATISTKKKQGAFTSAVHDVVQQHLPRDRWAAFFCPSATDPCLQVADYCTWAIQRKWERGCERSYNLIRDRITHEYDLFARGTKLHF